MRVPRHPPGSASKVHSLKVQLTDDFKGSSHTVQQNYASNALFLCLNLLGDLDSPVARRLLQRDLRDWCQHVKDKKPHPHELPPQLQNKTQEELQIGPLLCELYRFSSGQALNQQDKFNPCLTDLTPLDNLILYGLAHGVQAPIPLQFGACNPQELCKALFRSQMFVKAPHNVSATLEMIESFQRYLPIAYPDLVK